MDNSIAAQNAAGGGPWFVAIVIGAIVLGLAIAYGMMRNRRRTSADKARTAKATQALYAKEDRDQRV
jgi:hypothetical protein